MEGGYLLDRGESSLTQAAWIEGGPERSRLKGLQIGKRRNIPLFAWRCPRCALVRLYAPEE
jgi:hypothetical protein